MDNDPQIQMLGETQDYAVWVSEEPEHDALIYHIELGNITIHLFSEEWEEFVDVMRQAMR